MYNFFPYSAKINFPGQVIVKTFNRNSKKKKINLC